MILSETYNMNNGLKIPKLALGTWLIDDDKVAEAVRQTIKIGYRHIDTAQAYGNERGVGEGVRTCGISRDQIFVTSKVAAENKTYESTSNSINETLRKMNLDYIDMMIIHSPQPWVDVNQSYNRYFEENRQIWKAMEDAVEAGKVRTIGVSNFLKCDIDNILENCKINPSVSRFARNTVDTLTTVRKLKEKGIEVYFEKENIYTLDSKGELLITIMSSLAQEESRSISENTTWGQRKRFADGKVSLPYKKFLGYERGEDGIPQIVEKEAKIVRLIYRLFLEGRTTTGIATHLTRLKVPTPAGKEKWTTSTIKSILTNEKYKGDALLQKFYTVDFLTKKKKKNEGEVPQYYVENSHEAIISPEVFDMVQYEFEKRKGRVQSGANCFSSKIVCGDCGRFYGSKIWHSNDKYRKIIWRCNAKFKNKEKCRTPHVTEQQIKEAFVKTVNSMIENKEQVIKDCKELILELTDTTLIEEKEIKLQGERSILYNSMKELIERNSRSKIDPIKYNERYEELRGRYDKVTEQLSKIEDLKFEMKAKEHKINEFIKNLKQSTEIITGFDEKLWYTLIGKVIINRDGNIKFEFKNGKII